VELKPPRRELRHVESPGDHEAAQADLMGYVKAGCAATSNAAVSVPVASDSHVDDDNMSELYMDMLSA
jgi:hypothetical protein